MKMIPPRPTIYNGIQMRSRLEAAWAEQFDALGFGWTYEPFAVATRTGQYLPDFRLEIPGVDVPVFAEVKPGVYLDIHTGETQWGVVLPMNEDNMESFNAAWEAMENDIERMASKVRASFPTSIFLMCFGADADGFVQMLVILEKPIDGIRSRHVEVAPVRCAYGCVGLSHDPAVHGCEAHATIRNQWHRIAPVPSLYAPNGFQTYEDMQDRPTDPIDHFLRGR